MPLVQNEIASAGACVVSGEATRPDEAARFGVYKQFNDPELRHFAGMKHRIHSLPAELFPGAGLPDRLARSLAKHRVVHIKELLEAFEFFWHTRRRLRRPVMVDLAAGHGLAGLIYALCEESVREVILLDARQPPSFERILAAVVEIGPWVAHKVSYREAPVCDGSAGVIPAGAGVVLVHACGALSDIGLRLGAAGGGPVAAMPCCYRKAEQPRVPALRRELGWEWSVDVSRAYGLRDAGYQVDFGRIPDAITPMNRVIVGWNRRQG